VARWPGGATQEEAMNKSDVKAKLKAQRIETPSWGYADSGTRFKVFEQPAAAVTLQEKLEDAAQVHKFTGVAPSVAIHIPWDKTDDWPGIRKLAADLGLAIGAVNPNLFQEPEYMVGSLCHPLAKVRKKAIDHMLECVEIAKKTGSTIISLWMADGTSYPGQDSFRKRKGYLQESLAECYGPISKARMRLLIEYKFFEPAFYATDIPDWGTSYMLALKLGEHAQVLVDLGHHAHGVNIEQIVATLLDEGKLGGFHFNNRKYADDDLTVGSINPYELFLIYNELVGAELDPATQACARNVAYMIDQSHNDKGKIEATIQSVMMIQEAYAKALLVDRDALKKAQDSADIVGAEETVRDAFNTDVRPILREVRQELGIDPEPLKAFRASGYVEARARERGARKRGGRTSGYQ
jgi:L-rhamnose isomerase/sugar isomerase